MGDLAPRSLTYYTLIIVCLHMHRREVGKEHERARRIEREEEPRRAVASARERSRAHWLARAARDATSATARFQLTRILSSDRLRRGARARFADLLG